jgi:hypothetical protein
MRNKKKRGAQAQSEKRNAETGDWRAESGKKTGCRGQNVIILLWVGRRCCAAETDARQRVPTKMNVVHTVAPDGRAAARPYQWISCTGLRRRTDARQRVPTNEFRAHGCTPDGRAAARPYQNEFRAHGCASPDARQRVPTNGFRAHGRAALLRRRNGRAAARPYQ